MDSKLFARVAAIGLAAVAITLGVIQMREPSPSPPGPLAIDAQVAPVDPLREELRRCQAIGVEAASDRTCLRAWAENRRRFLGSDARPMARANVPVGTEGAGVPGHAAPPSHPPQGTPIVKPQEPADEAAN